MKKLCLFILIIFPVVLMAQEKVLIQKISVNLDANPKVKKGNVESVTDAYFEIELNLLAENNEYVASKDVEKISVGNVATIYITNQNGTAIHFKNTTELLNYMSKRGYDMISQSKKQYGYNYTFKRK